jgi:hypothetical protein
LRDEKIELQPATEYLPMRLFGGKALVGTDTGALLRFRGRLDSAWRSNAGRVTSRKPTLLTPVLDGRDPDCVWHRLDARRLHSARDKVSKYGVARQMRSRISPSRRGSLNRRRTCGERIRNSFSPLVEIQRPEVSTLKLGE